MLLTLSNCQAGIVSNFYHSLSTAAVESGIIIAWSIGINLCTKLKRVIELYPLPALWSSWSFSRNYSKRCLVGSWASTMYACFVFGILLDSFLFRFSFPESRSASLFLSCKTLPPPLDFQLSPRVLMVSVYSPSSGSMKQMPPNLRALSSLAFSFAHYCSPFFWEVFHIVTRLKPHILRSVVAWIVVNLSPSHMYPFWKFLFQKSELCEPSPRNLVNFDLRPHSNDHKYVFLATRPDLYKIALVTTMYFSRNRECFFFRHMELISKFSVTTIDEVTLNRPEIFPAGLQRHLLLLSVETLPVRLDSTEIFNYTLFPP